jgi:hypothetical protein
MPEKIKNAIKGIPTAPNQNENRLTNPMTSWRIMESVLFTIAHSR